MNLRTRCLDDARRMAEKLVHASVGSFALDGMTVSQDVIDSQIKMLTEAIYEPTD